MCQPDKHALLLPLDGSDLMRIEKVRTPTVRSAKQRVPFFCTITARSFLSRSVSISQRISAFSGVISLQSGWNQLRIAILSRSVEQATPLQ